jgi:hypothetical protein
MGSKIILPNGIIDGKNGRTTKFGSRRMTEPSCHLFTMPGPQFTQNPRAYHQRSHREDDYERDLGLEHDRGLSHVPPRVPNLGHLNSCSFGHFKNFGRGPISGPNPEGKRQLGFEQTNPLGFDRAPYPSDRTPYPLGQDHETLSFDRALRDLDCVPPGFDRSLLIFNRAPSPSIFDRALLEFE